MARKLTCLVVVVVLVCSLVPIPPVANACGPYLAEAVFTDMRGPDFDYGEYLQGKLGIVQPSYYDMFLFGAYRNLSGAPFTKEEIGVLNPAMGTNPAMATTASERQVPDRNEPTEEALWHTAAGESDWKPKYYPDEQGVIRSEVRDGNYISYYNCLPDAFRTARERLEQHRQQFGADNPAVHSWIEAQRQVFRNCGAPYQYNQPPKAAVIPVSAPASDPPVIRYDREYQIAAAYFYAGDYEAAATRFRDLSKTEESPWHGIAGYLQARALIRKGTIGDGKGNLDRDSLLEAEKVLKQIIADPKQTAIHKPAKRRLDYLAARLRPEERRMELVKKLKQPGGSANFDQDKTDYFWLLDHMTRSIGAKDDLTNWIFAMKDKSPEATSEAIAQWQKTKSVPWLVAAMCKAEPARAEANELLKAAAQIPAASPAHTTLLFHSLRLQATLRKDPAHVIADLDRTIAGEFAGLPNSAKNQFLALRMSLAQSFEEFLRFAPRTASGVAYSYGMDDDSSLLSSMNSDHKFSAAHFDADAAAVLSEKIPLRMLAAAAKNEKLPEELQRLITLAAWTRAVLLKNDRVAQDLAPRVVQFAPELKASFESYFTSKSPEERTFAAAYAILRSPGLRPFVGAGIGRDTPAGELDNLRDNWWCSFAPRVNNQPVPGSYPYYPWRPVPASLKQIYPDGQIPTPRFLMNQDSSVAAGEFENLTKLPPAPDWLGSETIAFANSHVDDPRVPEALHLVVRATRFGCTGTDTGKTSKAAFDLLHQKYPDSTWAKQTPYWFK
jgi:hypothetical protein